jgi:hypothetical protein
MKKVILLIFLCILHIETSVSAQEKNLDLPKNSISIFDLLLIHKYNNNTRESAFININRTFFPHYSVNTLSIYNILFNIPLHKEEKSTPAVMKNKNNYDGLELLTGIGLYIFMSDNRQVDRILDAGSRVTENNRKYEKSGYFEF